MLRSDYKYSREGSAASATGRRDNSGICGTGDGGRQAGLGLLLAPGAEAAGNDSGGGGSGGKRGGSMKHWSPLAALGKRARDGLRRCNTVRSGLGGAEDGGPSSSTSASATPAAVADSGLGTRRNALSNIFLGLPSSGVRRLFAIYGIDDTRGSRSTKGSAPCSASPATTSATAAATTPTKCEESLFARHSRTASVRSRRPPNYAGPMQQQQYQHMLMMQQHQQHLLLPPGCPPQQPIQQHGQSNSGGLLLDKRRSSSMRDHQGRQHRKASSCYGNW